jgi:hypothetical protein
MSDVGNAAAWSAVVSGLVWNPATAIAQYWLEQKAAGNYLGIPVSDELQDPDTGGVQMAFSSGATVKWDATNGPSIA